MGQRQRGGTLATTISHLTRPIVDHVETDLELDHLFELTQQKMGETQRPPPAIDTKASIINLLRESVEVDAKGLTGDTHQSAAGGRRPHHPGVQRSLSCLPTIGEGRFTGTAPRDKRGDDTASTVSVKSSITRESLGAMSKAGSSSCLSNEPGDSSHVSDRNGFGGEEEDLRSHQCRSLPQQYSFGPGTLLSQSGGNLTSRVPISTRRVDWSIKTTPTVEDTRTRTRSSTKSMSRRSCSSWSSALSSSSSSLGGEGGEAVSPELEAKYGAIDTDPDVLTQLLADPLFVQCCMEAGVNPYDLFPTVADDVAARAHGPVMSRDSLDVLLKEQVRPTVLSIGPEMLEDRQSRRRVVWAILREYEEAKRTEAIRRKDEARRAEKSKAVVQQVASYFASMMVEQRTRSQHLLERVYRLRLREDEALHARRRQLEAQRRHKEDVLRAHEEAEAARRQRLVERGEEMSRFCESVQKRKDEMLEDQRSFYRQQLDERSASAMARVCSAAASRNESLARRREEGEMHRRRCKSEADGQMQAHRHQLVDQMERKHKSFEQSMAQLDEERKAYVSEKRASEVMHHWAILRRKAYSDVSRRNARLEKVQGSDNMNKVVKTFLEALAKEKSQFEKFQVNERHGMKKQEGNLLKSLTPGPGHYLGLDAARRLKPVKGFKISKSSGKANNQAASNPGPGDYELASVSSSASVGGQFSTATPVDYIEEQLMRSKELPGPGDYEFPSRRIKGGRFSQARSMSVVEQTIQHAKEVPGPGDYMNPDRPMDLIRPFLDEFKKLSKENLEELARHSVISGDDAISVCPETPRGMDSRGTRGTGSSRWMTVEPPSKQQTPASYTGRPGTQQRPSRRPRLT